MVDIDQGGAKTDCGPSACAGRGGVFVVFTKDDISLLEKMWLRKWPMNCVHRCITL